MNDYAVLMNKVPNVKTAWKDKYTTAIYTPNLNVLCDCSEKQPLPDYPRWIQTKQLHFLSIEERLEVGFGVWHQISGLFIPSTILDLCVKVIPSPPDEIIDMMSLLAWVPPSEVREYLNKSASQSQDILNNDKERERWKCHPLYSENKKSDLEKICKKNKIALTSSMQKHGRRLI